MVTHHPNLVAAMSYVERCEYYDRQIARAAPSRNSDYQQYAAFIRFLRYLGYDGTRTEMLLIGACYDYLAGPTLRPVAVEEVIAFLSRPWRTVLDQLEAYAPVAPQLVYLQILAVWESNPEETGAHARVAVESAHHLLEQCETFLAEKNEEHQQAQEEAQFARDCQARTAAREKAAQKRAQQEDLYDALTRLLIFGGGLLVGWLMGHRAG